MLDVNVKAEQCCVLYKVKLSGTLLIKLNLCKLLMRRNLGQIKLDRLS